MLTTGPWVLAATIIGSAMAFIDGTVVNVALPEIQTRLGATAVDAQWIVESYALFLPLPGAEEDLSCIPGQVPEFLRDGVEILLGNAHVPQAARELELFDEHRDAHGWISTECVCQHPPPILRDATCDDLQARREGDAGGVAMRHAVARPDPAS